MSHASQQYSCSRGGCLAGEPPAVDSDIERLTDALADFDDDEGFDDTIEARFGSSGSVTLWSPAPYNPDHDHLLAPAFPLAPCA